MWLRRDLRLDDNVALYHAGTECDAVGVAFVVNPPLLAQPAMGAPLVCAFFDALAGVRARLRTLGSELAIRTGEFATELPALARHIGADAVYYNEDYEPHALERDAAVERALAASGIRTYRYTDHVYFGANEIVRAPASPYRVFTPYKRRWLDARALGPRRPVPSAQRVRAKLLPAAAIGDAGTLPAPEQYGFVREPLTVTVNETEGRRRLRHFLAHGLERYAEDRDVPAIAGTSRLSADLRAGTVGIRECVESAAEAGHDGAWTWISELIWRDFYQMVLRAFPSVVTASFQSAGDRVPWCDADDDFRAWCEGRTGYPIVDAGMRQLNATGWMHNRLRMIAASFLTKHLLIDWRRGALYFEQHLIDADVAANNGGWQWAASTGTDAVPYFRIFNPAAQGRKFDPDGTFVRSMIPELGTAAYPAPIVDHAFARERAIRAFKAANARSGR